MASPYQACPTGAIRPRTKALRSQFAGDRRYPCRMLDSLLTLEFRWGMSAIWSSCSAIN